MLDYDIILSSAVVEVLGVIRKSVFLLGNRRVYVLVWTWGVDVGVI